MQDKKKKNIKVRDLKPKKDAKGGFAMTGPTRNATGAHGVTGPGHGVTRPGAATPETQARISRTMVRSLGAVFIFQSELRHLSSDFVIKKLPPPTPDRYEGRLFPPEQS